MQHSIIGKIMSIIGWSLAETDKYYTDIRNSIILSVRHHYVALQANIAFQYESNCGFLLRIYMPERFHCAIIVVNIVAKFTIS